MKDLLRRSVSRHAISKEVTSSQILVCANEFLIDVLPVFRSQDARAVSYGNGILKIATRSSATTQHLKPFEGELKQRLQEKFHDFTLTKIIFQINRQPHS